MLSVLREMEQHGLKVISLDDKNASGRTPLTEIDPFSFLSSFNRGISEENRKENWRFLKQKIVPLIQEYWFDDEKRVDEQRKALLS